MEDTSDIHEEFLGAYDSYADAIFRHCYFRIGDREVAKDIMQDTFMRTWEYITKGQKVDNIRAFLYRIANNLIIDGVRKKQPTSLEALVEKGFQPTHSDEKVKDVIDGAQAIGVLSQLDDADREVITMRYIDDLGPQEIAEVLNEKVNVISVRLNRALHKLRKFFPAS